MKTLRGKWGDGEGGGRGGGVTIFNIQERNNDGMELLTKTEIKTTETKLKEGDTEKYNGRENTQ